MIVFRRLVNGSWPCPRKQSAVDLLLQGHANVVAVLQYDKKGGFRIGSVQANDFRDRYGLIHARQVHLSFYDRSRLGLSDVAVAYLQPIFADAIGADDMEEVRRTLFHPGNLTRGHDTICRIKRIVLPREEQRGRIRS
jgi:hypothetical protein